MKLSLTILVTVAFAFTACNKANKSDAVTLPAANHADHAQSKAGGDAAAKDILYGCPMHKEMIGSKGDMCPKCNYMELVPVTWSLEGIKTVRVTTLPDYNPPKKK